VTALANHDAWCRLPEADYLAQKQAWCGRLNRVARAHLPAIADSVHDAALTSTDVFTPRTVRKFTGHLNGAIYGSTVKRRDGRTDVANLFLIGTDQGFLGVTGAMLSGISMANLHGLEGVTPPHEHPDFPAETRPLWKDLLHPAVIVRAALGYFVDIDDLTLFMTVREKSLNGLGLGHLVTSPLVPGPAPRFTLADAGHAPWRHLLRRPRRSHGAAHDALRLHPPLLGGEYRERAGR
jgi:hypothetical protein